MKSKIAVATLVFTGLTFVVAALAFLASVTPLFKQTIPIEFGFLIDDTIVQRIDLATGDSAKPILLRFQNFDKGALTGVVLELRFRRPLALSGTGQAIASSIKQNYKDKKAELSIAMR